jgi:phage terminase large subunit-like protein
VSAWMAREQDWRRGRSVAEALIDWRRDPAGVGLMDGLGEDVLDELPDEWKFWARPGQIAPLSDWAVWLIVAGRGFGKTRTGAEYVRGWAERDGAARIALVGATHADTRGVMVEGESGLLAIAPRGKRPVYEPSRRRVIWPNGAQAFLYSAEEPDALRGPQHHFAWGDELCKWAHARDTWDNLRMGLRLGARPRVVATTTPRPMPLLKALLADPGVAVTRGSTRDNVLNLPGAFLAAMEAAYAGTRLGRQELGGELIEDAEGALWTRSLIEGCRVAAAPGLSRVVVAVDPPAGGRDADACGIVVAGKGHDGRAYVVADASVGGLSPEGWARAVAAAAARYDADRVIAEANNGGDMVHAVLRSVEAALPVRLVRASHGKVTRAEPVAALYEAGRVAHVGAFPLLEDEMCGLIAGGAYAGPGRSPDRADALVWALSELMLGGGGGGGPARPGMRAL